MKHIYFIILFLSFGALQAQSLEKVRAAYITASDSKENAVAFVELMAQRGQTAVRKRPQTATSKC